MERDNTVGDHIFLNTVVANEKGESCFADKSLPYDQTLGPLRQSSVIPASQIVFNLWPKGFDENITECNGPMIILMLEGCANFIVSSGESRVLKPGDVLEYADPKRTKLKLRALRSQEFRTAVIYLDQSLKLLFHNIDDKKSKRSLPFVRNITGEDERSHFHDGELEYYERVNQSLFTKAISIKQFQYVYAAADLRYDFHNAPQRQIVLPLTGGTQGENGDGSRRVIPVGGVYFGEDVTGEGHITSAVNDAIRFSIFAHLS